MRSPEAHRAPPSSSCDGQRRTWAEELAAQFGRGDREVQLRALVALGEEVVAPALRKAMASTA